MMYHVLDSTTPWFEFLSYMEASESLSAPGHPSVTRFIRYHNYLKEIELDG